MSQVSETLPKLVLPESCREVTVEMETRKDSMLHWDCMVAQIEILRKIGLAKRDGESLSFDEESSCLYTWKGTPRNRGKRGDDTMYDKKMVEYRTIRLVWRLDGASREFISHDVLGCLELDGCKEVKSVRSLVSEGWK